MSGCGCQCGGACGGGHAASAPPAPSWSLADFFGASDIIGLAGLTPDQAASQAIGAGTGVNSGSKAAILASARAGQMLDAGGSPAYIPGTVDCAAISGSGSNNLSLVKAGTGLALTGLQIGLTTAGVAVGAALAPVTFGISSIIGLFTMFSQHHAQAVKREQSVLCAAVPAANNYLQVIAQAVQSGAASPQDGIHALDSLLGDFRSQVGSIEHQCNAACVMTLELQAIVLEMQSQYQDLLAAQATNQVVAPARPNTTTAAGAPSVPGASPVPTPSSYSSFYAPPGTVAATSAPSTLPSWLPIAAAVAAGLFLMREL